MDSVKVKALLTFRDRENDLVTRKEGEIFEAPKKRAEHLQTIGYVEIVKPKTEK